MSISPVANQAAAAWVAPVEIKWFREAFAYGYDAATAKLREELKCERAKLREELDSLCFLDDNGKVWNWRSDKHSWVPQLAHQQPSALLPPQKRGT